jgi:molecular chaperone GrpE (heat shock protein)
MNEKVKEELLYLLDQLNKYLFYLEQELEEDVDINTEKWKKYYEMILNVHSTMNKIENTINFS